VVTLSETGLASSTAVQILVLKIVLGSAVAGGGAAAVEVTIGTGTRAADTALGMAANVNLRDAVREILGGRGRGRRGSALGRGAGEGLQACLRVAMVDSGSAPAVLRA
jgi:hypothetical protein